MKITINKNEDAKVGVGDLIILHVHDEPDTARLIVKDNGLYRCLDIEDGQFGYDADSVEELVTAYRRYYDDITIVKNSEIEVKVNVGGR